MEGTDSAPTYCGRTAELERFAALAAALEARPDPRLILVTGDDGMGKSRLLGECMRRLRGRGVPLYGRACEGEQLRAFGPWRDALRPLERFFPGGDIFPSGGDPPGPDPERLFAGVTAALRAAAAESPLGLFLDDAHWMDASSWALLRYLLHRKGDAPILVMAAMRGAGLEGRAPGPDLAPSSGDGGVWTWALAALDDKENAALVDTYAPDLDAGSVFAAGGGNPLFTLEIIRHRQAGSEGKPDNLPALLRGRLGALGSEAREVAGWASALGRTFSIPELEPLLDLQASALLGALEELERRGLIQGSHGGALAPHYGFNHELYRQCAYAALSEPRRQGMHRQIALGLSEAGISLRPHRLALHAALGGEWILAASACAQAAEQGLAQSAVPEAVAFAEQGLDHLEHAQPVPADLRAALAGLRDAALRHGRETPAGS